MAEKKQDSFVKIGIDEVLGKIRGLVDEGIPFKMWSKGKKHFLCKPIDYHFHQNMVQIKFAKPKGIRFEAMKNVLFNFNQGKIDYFGKGEIVDQSTGEFIVLADRSLYKTEKRFNERLLTFPHRQVYSYFSVSKNEDGTNVVSMAQHRRNNKKAFDSFYKTAMSPKIDSGEVNADELLGFRVLDISFRGVSFLANEEEAEFFKNKGDKKHDFFILFDQDVYKGIVGNVVYIVDYVSQRSSQVSMFKIGINFAQHDQIVKKILSIFSEGESLEAFKKEFEEIND